jgi:hypothetical protein
MIIPCSGMKYQRSSLQRVSAGGRIDCLVLFQCTSFRIVYDMPFGLSWQPCSNISLINTLHNSPRHLAVASLRRPTRIQRRQCLVVPLPRIPRCSASGKVMSPRSHTHTVYSQPSENHLLNIPRDIRRRANTQGPLNSEKGTKRQHTHRDCQTSHLPSIDGRSSARHSQNGR